MMRLLSEYLRIAISVHQHRVLFNVVYLILTIIRIIICNYLSKWSIIFNKYIRNIFTEES